MKFGVHSLSIDLYLLLFGVALHGVPPIVVWFMNYMEKLVRETEKEIYYPSRNPAKEVDRLRRRK